MARSSSTLDPFNAIAEPRRRQMLTVLIEGGSPVGELQVNDLVESLGWPQPQVSKHLAVLRQAGLVSVRREGRKRMYRINGDELKPVHDWVKTFEQFWTHKLSRIKDRAERTARERAPTTKHNHHQENGS